MSKNDKDKKKKSFEEQIFDSFPDDLKPDFKPHDYDPINDTPEQIIDALRVRNIYKTLLQDENDKKMFDSFLDGLIKERTESFNKIRDGLKNDQTRRSILKGIIESVKYGRS